MLREPRRARRRRLTRKAALRRRKAHIRWSHPVELGDVPSCCICERSVHYFSKRPALDLFWWHRNRLKGRPRQTYGDVGERNHIYNWRSQSRELNRLLSRHQGVDPLSDRVSMIADPRTRMTRAKSWDRHALDEP